MSTTPLLTLTLWSTSCCYLRIFFPYFPPHFLCDLKNVLPGDPQIWILTFKNHNDQVQFIHSHTPWEANYCSFIMGYATWNYACSHISQTQRDMRAAAFFFFVCLVYWLLRGKILLCSIENGKTALRKKPLNISIIFLSIVVVQHDPINVLQHVMLFVALYCCIESFCCCCWFFGLQLPSSNSIYVTLYLCTPLYTQTCTIWFWKGFSHFLRCGKIYCYHGGVGKFAYTYAWKLAVDC